MNSFNNQTSLKYSKLSDFDESFLKIIKHFFRIYKQDINEDVEVGEWHNGQKALSIVQAAHERFILRLPFS